MASKDRGQVRAGFWIIQVGMNAWHLGTLPDPRGRYIQTAHCPSILNLELDELKSTCRSAFVRLKRDHQGTIEFPR